jgi:hypothetical protein
MSTEEKVVVKTMASMLTYAISQVAKMDEEYANKLKALGEEVIQWKIGDDIAYYQILKDGDIKEVEGISDSPTLTFEIADVSAALKMLTGQAGMDAMVGKMNISDGNKALKLGFMMEKVGEYMEGMGG